VNAHADETTAGAPLAAGPPPTVRSGVVWDARWRGRHGIGRHAEAISQRLPGGIEQLTGRGDPASPFDPLRLSVALARRRPNIFVSPGYNSALRSDCHQLLTVHDLIHLHDPAESSRLKRAYYQALVGPAIRRTKMVLTVSHHSAVAISEWAQIPLDWVKVVGNGTSIGQASGGDLADADRHRGRAGRYLLYVGNDKPHKNLPLLFDALRHIDRSVRVVLVGPSPRLCERVGLSRALSERLIFRPTVTDAELRDLYLNASCLVLPSREEGFGLPALEAMALGVRTVYCCEAVHEIVGDLGFRTSADEPESFAAAVNQSIHMDQVDRSVLVARSLLFGWDAVADRVVQAIAGISA
jgi:glycosyltransferase involved in cell wall biosynthesis